MSAATASINPKVVTHGEWVKVRKALLEKEKELTRARDALLAERRSTLPMFKVSKRYVLKNEAGEDVQLADLFAGKDQLIVYHFMFAPAWDEGCRGCAHAVECFPDYRHLRFRNTSLVLVSRAEPEKLVAHKTRAAWTLPWFSSAGSDFSYDFDQVISARDGGDENGGRFAGGDDDDDGTSKPAWGDGETGNPGITVFYKQGNDIFHADSRFDRGIEGVLGTYQLLDMTPLGRQDTAGGPAAFSLRGEYGEDN